MNSKGVLGSPWTVNWKKVKSVGEEGECCLAVTDRLFASVWIHLHLAGAVACFFYVDTAPAAVVWLSLLPQNTALPAAVALSAQASFELFVVVNAKC